MPIHKSNIKWRNNAFSFTRYEIRKQRGLYSSTLAPLAMNPLNYVRGPDFIAQFTVRHSSAVVQFLVIERQFENRHKNLLLCTVPYPTILRLFLYVPYEWT